MEKIKDVEFFTTRHSIKPQKEEGDFGGKESDRYPGLANSGVELARQRAREDVLKMIEQAPEGAVVFLGGASEQVRTKSTAEIYGDELAEIAVDREREMKIVTREEIFQMAEAGNGYSKIVGDIKSVIEKNPQSKIVIDFPLFLKEFSLSDRWFDESGKPNEYMMKILEKNDFDEFAAMKDWISGEGKIDDLAGPNPVEAAKAQMIGLKRLEEFARKQIPDRPLVVGFVGHSFHMDVLAVYLANNGKVNLEGLDKLGSTMTTETEMARIKIESGKAKLYYRGQEFDIDKNIYE